MKQHDFRVSNLSTLKTKIGIDKRFSRLYKNGFGKNIFYQQVTKRYTIINYKSGLHSIINL